MYNTYLITYDLTYPETSSQYDLLIKTIKTAPYWAKPLKSVWLVKTTLSSMEVLRQLRSVTDDNDKILVIEVTNKWASYFLPTDVVEWMKGKI